MKTMIIGGSVVLAAVLFFPHNSDQRVRVDADAVSDSTWSCLRAVDHSGRPGDGADALYPTRTQLNRCWFPAP